MCLPLVKPEQNKRGVADFAFFSFTSYPLWFHPYFQLLYLEKLELYVLETEADLK